MIEPSESRHLPAAGSSDAPVPATRFVQAANLIQELANRTALDVLDRMLAAVHADGSLAAVAAQATALAQETARAADHVRHQLSVLESLAKVHE